MPGLLPLADNSPGESRAPARDGGSAPSLRKSRARALARAPLDRTSPEGERHG